MQQNNHPYNFLSHVLFHLLSIWHIIGSCETLLYPCRGEFQKLFTGIIIIKFFKYSTTHPAGSQRDSPILATFSYLFCTLFIIHVTNLITKHIPHIIFLQMTLIYWLQSFSATLLSHAWLNS